MAPRPKKSRQPLPRCEFCQVFLGDSNYGGSTGDGKMADKGRNKGICVKCAELLELAR